MVVTAVDNGITIKWNRETKRWEYMDGEPYYFDHKRVCNKCGIPRLDINGVKDCDFCLQGLTTCDSIQAACCGHGCDEEAYIYLKDGRRFVLDKVIDIEGVIL